MAFFCTFDKKTRKQLNVCVAVGVTEEKTDLLTQAENVRKITYEPKVDSAYSSNAHQTY